MTLEDLVPNLNLCKRLPAGEFGETALVWVFDSDGIELVLPREVAIFEHSDDVIPAPTLAEIMAELPPETECSMSDMGVWCIINPKIESIGEKANNPATAALRLWLKLKGVEG